MHQSTVSKASSVQLNCATSAVIGSRPRGRRPRRKTLNGIANGKILQRSGIKKTVENKGCNSTSTVTKEDSESSDLECLIQQQLPINPCNGTANYIDKNDHKNVSLNDNTIKKHSVMLPEIDENKECNIGLTNHKKNNSRKRKQSDMDEPVAEKRILISDNSNDSLGLEKNLTTPSSLLNKPSMVVDIITFNFLKDSNSNKTNKQYAGIRQLFSNCYGRTYWPTNWEYSAAALTSHIQKKMTKDTLRKIRLLCSVEANKANNSVSLKTNLNLKKSVIQRRGSASKLAALASVEISSISRHNISTSFTNAKRRKGRPPGRKNKLLMGVVKSNSPRKSPRQHASTLAIMSTKVLNTDDKLEITQPKDTINTDDPNTNSGDMDGPCVLPIEVPKHERKQGDRRRRRRRLDHQHSILERRRKRRSSTPSPPKLCAQQPAPQPQRNSINNTVVVDQEVVKLRTKHVDVVRRRARDERLRSAFVCQQLHQVNEIAEKGREDLLLNDEEKQDYQLFDNSILENCQNQIWSSQMDCSIYEPDNMCLQIMYEQTGDKKFLSTELTDETLQIYYQQRDLALAERMTNNCYGDTISSDLGTDMLLGGNKRKKKRPNMTGWPKEKRRKTITTTNSSVVETHNDDQEIDMEIIARRRKAAEQQRLRRQRIKLEQQLAKENSKVKQVAVSIRKRPGRRPGPKKKNVISTYRTTSVSSVVNNVITESNNTNSSTMIKRKNIKVRKERKNRKSIQNKTEITNSVPETTDETPQTVVKRRLGRPKGSIGHRKRIKLEMLKRSRNQTPTDQQKENVVEPQTSTGKLKCVISTRNNRMKLLSSSSSSTFATSNKRRTATGTKIKKSSSAYNISTSCLTSSPLSETIVVKSTRITAKKRRLQQQQMTSATTWDVGRPKRYHSTNHGRSVSGVAVEEDCCFVGSQPFEQHCPGSGSGLSQNTVFENLENHQKDNTVHGGL